MTGVGNQMLILLVVESDDHQTAEIYCRSSPDPPLSIQNALLKPVTAHGSQFTHVLGPSRAIEGFIHDAVRGVPVPNVTVSGPRLGVSDLGGVLTTYGLRQRACQRYQ